MTSCAFLLLYLLRDLIASALVECGVCVTANCNHLQVFLWPDICLICSLVTSASLLALHCHIQLLLHWFHVFDMIALQPHGKSSLKLRTFIVS